MKKALLSIFLGVALIIPAFPQDIIIVRKHPAGGGGGGSAPVFDAVSGNYDVNAVTLAHTCTGSNRLLLIWCVTGDASRAVETVTYNGVSATLIGSPVVGVRQLSLWRLIAPSSGTHNIVATLESGFPAYVWATGMSFTGVNQTTALGTLVTATASDDTPTATVSSATNELVADFMQTQAGGSQTLTVGAGQTERINDTTTLTDIQVAGSTQDGAASVVMSWEISNPLQWTIGAVPIKPV